MLLIGPPGSGKTHLVLGRLEAAVRAGRSDRVQLVVPTASMAQHTLHTLARRGLVVPGDLVVTLHEFVGKLTPDLKEPSPAVESWLLDQAVRTAGREEFRALEDTAGLRAAVARTMHEFWAAGCDSETVGEHLKTPFQQAFGWVFRAYEQRLASAGYGNPWAQFLRAAERIREGALGSLKELYFDGFVNLTAGERTLISAAAEKVRKIVVTLPKDLDEGGFSSLAGHRLKEIHRPVVTPTVVEAGTPAAEVEEVARRILRDGAPFHTYGIVLRSQEIYAPLIAAVFERFGIPFRLPLPRPLAQHGGVRFVTNLLHSIAEGFPAEEVLDLLKRPICVASHDPGIDAFEFAVREKLPGDGLAFLRQHAQGFAGTLRRLEALASLADWKSEECSPQEWADRCRSLHQEWLKPPAVEDDIPMVRVLELRAFARALAAFEDALNEAVRLVELGPDDRVSLAAFLAALEAVVRHTLIRTPDQRRNVVHVLSIFEARQWELPTVFVLGLVEGQFPRHYSQDLFFPDSDRLALRERGVSLPLKVEQETDEKFLFEIATTRATKKLILSYPRADEQGRPLLRSFLFSQPKEQVASAEPVRLREAMPVPAVATSHLRSRALKECVSEKHERFSPTTLESFLQCPFKFFAEKTLGLKEPPVKPEERLDARIEGSIVHRTIALWSADRSVPIGDVLRQVFDEECRANAIPPGFRTLVSRCRIEEDLERFVNEELAAGLPGSQAQKIEAEFKYLVDDLDGAPFHISGRIDRYEVMGGNLGFVIDYKYSSDDRVRKLMKDHFEGARLQGPLYLAGLERELGIKPAGMRFWGLRRKPTMQGWAVEGLLPAELMHRNDMKLTRSAFEAMLDDALHRAADAIDEIRDGRIEVAPRDTAVCNSYCPFRDLCRIQL